MHLAGLCWQCGVFSRVVLVGKALPLLFSVVGWGSVGGGDAVMQIWCITVNGWQFPPTYSCFTNTWASLHHWTILWGYRCVCLRVMEDKMQRKRKWFGSLHSHLAELTDRLSSGNFGRNDRFTPPTPFTVTARCKQMPSCSFIESGTPIVACRCFSLRNTLSTM